MSFLGLLNQTITVYPKASYDGYGREVISSGVNHKARVQEVTKSRLLPNGQVAIIDALVFVRSTASININDRMDYNGTTYKVFGKKVAVDGAGKTHHYELELQKWQQT